METTILSTASSVLGTISDICKGDKNKFIKESCHTALKEIQEGKNDDEVVLPLLLPLKIISTIPALEVNLHLAAVDGIRRVLKYFLANTVPLAYSESQTKIVFSEACTPILEDITIAHDPHNSSVIFRKIMKTLTVIMTHAKLCGDSLNLLRSLQLAAFIASLSSTAKEVLLKKMPNLIEGAQGSDGPELDFCAAVTIIHGLCQPCLDFTVNQGLMQNLKSTKLNLLSIVLSDISDSISKSSSFNQVIYKYVFVFIAKNITTLDVDICREALGSLKVIAERFWPSLGVGCAVCIVKILLPLLDKTKLSPVIADTIYEFLLSVTSNDNIVEDCLIRFDSEVGNLPIIREIFKKLCTQSRNYSVEMKADNVIQTLLRSLKKIADSKKNVEPEKLLSSTSKLEAYEKFICAFNESKGSYCDIFKRLVENKVLNDQSPKEVAIFLRNSKDTDLRAVGRFLGKNDDFSRAVLKEYIGLTDMSGLLVDEALRQVLLYLPMPEESGGADRVVELFATVYCDRNQGDFSVASVGVLSFAIILLSNDAHSARVLEKMSLSQFIKNNRGLNDGSDFSEELLTGIYDRVTKREVKLRRLANQTALVSIKESEKNLECNLVEGIDDTFNSYCKSSELCVPSDECVGITGYVMHHVWSDLLSALSILLKTATETKTIDLALDCFSSAIYICSWQGRENELKTFLSSLLAITRLVNRSALDDKNIRAIKTLVDASFGIKDHLAEGWEEVVRCYGCLYRLADAASISSSSSSSDESKQAIKVDKKNANALRGAVDMKEVDCLFSEGCSQLSDKSIVSFVKAICIAVEEERSEVPPCTRMFKRMFRVMELNVDRSTSVFQTLWGEVCFHITIVVEGEVQHSAVLAFQSLRKLTALLLSKGDDDTIRGAFLLFESLSRNSQFPELLDAVVTSLGQFIRASDGRLFSSWIPAMRTLLNCLNRRDELQMRSALLMHEIMAKHIDVFVHQGDCVAELLQCWGGVARRNTFRQYGLWHIRMFLAVLPVNSSTRKATMQKLENPLPSSENNNSGVKPDMIAVRVKLLRELVKQLDESSNQLVARDEEEKNEGSSAVSAPHDEGQGRIKRDADIPLCVWVAGFEALKNLCCHEGCATEAFDMLVACTVAYQPILRATDEWEPVYAQGLLTLLPLYARCCLGTVSTSSATTTPLPAALTSPPLTPRNAARRESVSSEWSSLLERACTELVSAEIRRATDLPYPNSKTGFLLVEGLLQTLCSSGSEHVSVIVFSALRELVNEAKLRNLSGLSLSGIGTIAIHELITYFTPNVTPFADPQLTIRVPHMEASLGIVIWLIDVLQLILSCSSSCPTPSKKKKTATPPPPVLVPGSFVDAAAMSTMLKGCSVVFAAAVDILNKRFMGAAPIEGSLAESSGERIVAALITIQCSVGSIFLELVSGLPQSCMAQEEVVEEELDAFFSALMKLYIATKKHLRSQPAVSMKASSLSLSGMMASRQQIVALQTMLLSYMDYLGSIQDGDQLSRKAGRHRSMLCELIALNDEDVAPALSQLFYHVLKPRTSSTTLSPETPPPPSSPPTST